MSNYKLHPFLNKKQPGFAGSTGVCTWICIILFGLSSTLPVAARTSIQQVTSVEGINVQFRLPELEISDVHVPNRQYQSVSYAECSFTAEPGNPKVPVTRVMLGIPATAEVGGVDVSAGALHTRASVRLVPVPHTLRTSSSLRGNPEVSSVERRWEENGRAYQARQPYPGQPLARIIHQGYIRSQRIVVLALYPVQYLPHTRQLRTYTDLSVHIRFRYPNAALGTPLRREPVQESETFERVFSQQLLNAQQAAHFRSQTLPQQRVAAAPAQGAFAPNATRYKIFVEETGVHAITAESLQRDWHINDLVGINPATLRMWRGNREIPIYISGVADGRFDPGDAIFFLGHKPQNPYTRWNVYWITVHNGGSTPARVPQIIASPGDPTATQVPSFRSELTFEEDHLTSNLEFVPHETVSPGDKHGWFEALDFWYWDGIKNGSDRGEMRLEFPLYDVAKSFDPPHISVDLQGGTPVLHEILVAINGVRIDLAKWEQQDTLTVKRALRAADTFKDMGAGEVNVLSLARVDDTFEEDTTRYPYHVYVNRFSVTYTRLFRAVRDELWFATPAQERKTTHPRKLQYKLEAFRDANIHIFETDGTHLTARMQGVAIEETPVQGEARARWKSILTAWQADTAGDANADLSLPRTAFNAIFQVLDTRNTRFIAVSESALRQPAHVEIVPSSDLASTVHGADYVIVTHPKFRMAADRLAAWRATSTGGGYRTKVVTTDDIYNTFGDGSVHPNAIKAFLTHAYQHWLPPALTYCVLFGDGTFDFRGIDTELYPVPPELAGYIPTHYIHTDSFGRTSSDHWYATVSGYDEFTDFYIGRLSVETTSQADAIVDKIVAYEQQRPSGDWRRKIISVADDEISNSGDFIFKKSLNEIAKDHTRLGYETVEIFLEDIIDEWEAHPEDYPQLLPKHIAKDRIIEALNEGAVLAQYAGHGGRIVWAHEDIFDNAAAERVDETPKIPFMLVLSCYNGYFDKPGEPSMAEKLLRKERGGIIGMLSATRLTYASGNDALNRIIFDMLFKRNIRQLGPLSFDSKVELLITEGTGQIDVMMEYTLFGDPALQIAIAEDEIRPEIETKTVAPGDTLRIAPGYIQSVRYDAQSQTKRYARHAAFDGTLTVKAVFPGKTAIGQGVSGPVEYYTGDVIVTKTLSVKGGAYPAVSLTVPQNIAAGDAHVEYYAENATTLAVGGDGFTVNVPKILAVQPELVGDDKFRISVQVSDEKASLAAVILTWRNPETRQWEQVRFIPAEQGADWWTMPEPLTAPTDGSVVRYDIQVTDTDENTVTSEMFRYYPYTYPNLSVVRAQSEDIVRYGYRPESKQAYLAADVQWVGSEISSAVEVAFFRGNPDVDDDMLVDSELKAIGTTRIEPTDWVQHTPFIPETGRDGNSDAKPQPYQMDPLNTYPIATATLNIGAHELPLGVHDIFVYVDPIMHADEKPGNVLENDEEDNIAYRRLFVNTRLVGPTPNQIVSLDGTCVITAPPRTLDTPTVLTIQPLHREPPEQAAVIGFQLSQRDAFDSQGITNKLTTEKLIPLPGGALGYHLLLENPAAPQIAAGDAPTLSTDFMVESETKTPVTVALNFDLDALRQQLIGELIGTEEGAAEASESTVDVSATVDRAIAAHASGTGIYLWREALGNWARLASQQVTDASGNLLESVQVTSISDENAGIGTLRDVRIHPDGAQNGKWVLLFTGPRTYRLFLVPEVDSESIGVLNPSHKSQSGPGLEFIAAARQLTNFSPDFPNFTDGFALNFELGDVWHNSQDSEEDAAKPFAFGDVWSFRITSLENTPEDQSNLNTLGGNQRWYASSFRDSNEGTGTVNYVELSPDTAMPADQWIILFVSDTEFQVEGEKTGVLRTADGAPLLGKIGAPFFYAPYGLRFQLTQGERPFAAGDRFRFQTRTVGTIRATTQMLGPVTLLHTDDTVPPDIQLTIGNQQHFVPGDATDAAPLIGATLTDDSGLDYITRPLVLELGGPSGTYERIDTDAYQVTHHPGSNQLVLTYPSPELAPREYELRLTASDVHGNSDTKRMTFRVHGSLQLVSFLNYPNPFTRKTTLTCELTAPADSLAIKIYTLSGRLIRELSTQATAGFLMVEWDGTDADGIEVANGVYYGKIHIKREGEKDITEILKMMKLR